MEKRNVTIHRNAIESFLMNVKEFIKAHRKPVLVGAVCFFVAVLMILAAAVYYDISSTSDLRKYEKITSDYDSSKDATAFNDTVTKLSLLAEKSHFGYVHKNGFYLVAGMYFERKMYDEAKGFYLKFIDRSKSSLFAPLALFQAGICAENTDKYDEALSLYRRIEKDYKDSGFNDRVFYDIARMSQKKGDRVTAKEYFEKVITQFPNSFYAAQAKMRIFLLGM